MCDGSFGQAVMWLLFWPCGAAMLGTPGGMIYVFWTAFNYSGHDIITLLDAVAFRMLLVMSCWVVGHATQTSDALQSGDSRREKMPGRCPLRCAWLFLYVVLCESLSDSCVAVLAWFREAGESVCIGVRCVCGLASMCCMPISARVYDIASDVTCVIIAHAV